MAKLTPLPNENDHMKGNLYAPIVMVEYCDYQCPDCGRVQPELKRLQKTMGDELCFIFRHFPLKENHEYAFQAAICAEAAARQDIFWPMHELIFRNQQSLHEDTWMDLADSLNLDLDQFQSDMQNPALKRIVDANFMSGALSGVKGTPTLFINGQRYDGLAEFEEIMAAIPAQYHV